MQRDPLVTNAVLDTLRAEGYEIHDDDIKHFSPARHEHINPHGK